jgi:hypothetical protein
VREGTFKGNYVMNLREQMEDRMRRGEGEARKVKVLFVGGSQMGRVKNEVVNVGHQVVSECGWVAVKGELSEAEMVRVVREVRDQGIKADKVIFGGPGNSLVKHGKGPGRGHHPERMVTVERDLSGNIVKVDVRYHMTEPVRVSMTERRGLTDRMVRLMEGVSKETGASEGIYVTMFPRHVERCCHREGHMTDGDCMTMTSVRMDVDRDIREEVRERGVKVRVLDWWKVLKLEGEGAVKDILDNNVVCGDGVHLTPIMNKTVAVYLCHRLLETVGEEEEDNIMSVGSSSKRSRHN